jgi:hypothetical protein
MGKNKPGDHGTTVNLWPIQKVGHPDSDVQQLKFWQAMLADFK